MFIMYHISYLFPYFDKYIFVPIRSMFVINEKKYFSDCTDHINVMTEVHAEITISDTVLLAKRPKRESIYL